MESFIALMTTSVPTLYPLFRRPERKEGFSNPPPPPMRANHEVVGESELVKMGPQCLRQRRQILGISDGAF